MKLNKLTIALDQALLAYQTTRSDAARKQARRAPRRYLQAGGHAAFKESVQEKSA